MRGLRSKIKDIEKFNFVLHDYDILVFTETWLCPEILSAEFRLDEFIIYRNDRNPNNSHLSRGGGVLIAIKKNYQSYQLNSSLDVEHLFIHVINSSTNLIISSTYFPPLSSVATFRSHCESVEQLELLYPNVKWLMFGDYNLPKVTWEISDLACCPIFKATTTLRERVCASILADTLSFLNLTQINQIVNENNSLLDLIFSEAGSHSVSFAPDAIVSADTYHPPLILCL